MECQFVKNNAICMILFHILASSSSSLVHRSGVQLRTVKDFNLCLDFFGSFRPYHVLKNPLALS